MIIRAFLFFAIWIFSFLSPCFTQLGKVKTGNKNAVWIEPLAAFGKKNFEFTGVYERRLSSRWTFRNSFTVLKNKRFGDLKPENRSKIYTETATQECVVIIIIPICGKTDKHYSSQPFPEVKTIRESQSAWYWRTGFSYFTDQKQSSFGNSGLYVGVDFLAGKQKYREYILNDTKTILEQTEERDYEGFPLLVWGWNEVTVSEIEQTQTFHQENRSTSVFGWIMHVGVRIPMGKFAVFNLEGQYGISGSLDGGFHDLGRATPDEKSVYRKLTAGLGFLF